MTSLIGLFIFLLLLLATFSAGYAVGYILMLAKKYEKLKEDIKKAEEDLFLVKELLKRQKNQIKWDYKITQQRNSEQS